MIYFCYTCNILQQKVSRCLRSLKRVLCRWRDPGAQELLPNTVSYVRKCCKEAMCVLDDVRCVFDGWIVSGCLKQMIRIIIGSQPRSVHNWSDKRYSKIWFRFEVTVTDINFHRSKLDGRLCRHKTPTWYSLSFGWLDLSVASYDLSDDLRGCTVFTCYVFGCTR